MPGPTSAFDVLHTWVINLTRIQDICVKSGFGHGVGGMTLNIFARQKVIQTVGNGRNFLVAVAHAIGGFDPDNPSFTLGDTSSFAELTDWVSPYFLLDATDFYIRSTAGRGADVIPAETKVVDLFSASAWQDFAQGITRSNLDSVIGKPAEVTKKLAKFHSDDSTETYWSLLSFLSTIEPAPDEGK